VVNKPSDVSFGDVLTQIGLEAGPLDEDRTVMVGGPVSPDTGWVVFDARDGDECGDGVIELENSVGVSANMEILERIARGEGPDTFLMMLGYAGWGPGQLDDEIRDGSWIPVDLDPALVFDTPVGERWAAALAKLGIDPARMTSRFVADA
jgi:putative transcriptional regulator